MSKKRVVINDDVKLINNKYCYDFGGREDKSKTVKTINDFTKTYCYDCDEPTETINKKKEYPDDEGICIIKGNCEVCNIVKFNYNVHHVDKILYCFRCKEITDSIQRRRLYLDGENVYVNKCEICKTVKIDKFKYNHGEDVLYCYICKKFTESINKKEEYWKKRDIHIIKCNCKICDTFRIDKVVKKFGNVTLLI